MGNQLVWLKASERIFSESFDVGKLSDLSERWLGDGKRGGWNFERFGGGGEKELLFVI